MTHDELYNALHEGNTLAFGLPGVERFALIGSARYLPADQVNDVDFCVLLQAPNQATSYAAALADSGWGRCGEYDNADGLWCAMRRGPLNFMLTHDAVFYSGYLLAMDVCEALRLEDKAERIAVCQLVRDRKPLAEVLAQLTVTRGGAPV